MLWKTFSQKMWAALVEVYPRIMIARFKDPLQVLLLTGGSWSSKAIDSEVRNKYFTSGKIKETLWKLVMKYKNVFLLLFSLFSQSISF